MFDVGVNRWQTHQCTHRTELDQRDEVGVDRCLAQELLRDELEGSHGEGGVLAVAIEVDVVLLGQHGARVVNDEDRVRRRQLGFVLEERLDLTLLRCRGCIDGDVLQGRGVRRDLTDHPLVRDESDSIVFYLPPPSKRPLPRAILERPLQISLVDVALFPTKLSVRS